MMIEGVPLLRTTCFALLSVMAIPAAAQNTASGGEPLSRADFISQMDMEFSRLDGDGNGFINPEEIVSSQRQAAQTEALRQNAQVFAGLDKDGNGQLSAQEFATLANPDAIPVTAEPLMQQFDSDRDGIITLVEYRIATQGNFNSVDSDRNGIITDAEMRAGGIVR